MAILNPDRSVMQNIKTRKDHDRLIVETTGKLGFEDHVDFRAAYEENLGFSEYVIDLSNLEFMDSCALGMLIAMYNKVGDGTTITLKNPQSKVKLLLEIVRLDKIFRIEGQATHYTSKKGVNGIEKRQHARFNIQATAHIQSRNTGKLPCQLVDISLGSCRVKFINGNGDAFSENEIVELDMDIENHIQKKLHITAKIIRMADTTSLEFIPDIQSRQLLNRLIRALLEDEMHSRKNSRKITEGMHNQTGFHH